MNGGKERVACEKEECGPEGGCRERRLSLREGFDRTGTRLSRDEVVRAEKVSVGRTLDGIESTGL